MLPGQFVVLRDGLSEGGVAWQVLNQVQQETDPPAAPQVAQIPPTAERQVRLDGRPVALQKEDQASGFPGDGIP